MQELEETFHSSGNTKANAIELLNSHIQLWMNSLQVRGNEINILGREDATHEVNAVNWQARCKITYKLQK
jgi:hypothetical protein